MYKYRACTQLCGTSVFILQTTSAESATVIDDSLPAFPSAALLQAILQERRADYYYFFPTGSLIAVHHKAIFADLLK